MKKPLVTCCLITATLLGFAQSDSVHVIQPKELPSVHAGIGALYFRGDYGKENGIQVATRPALVFGVEQRLGAFFSAGVDGLYGKLATSERTVSSNRNFESKALQFGLKGIFHFDNDVLLKRSTPLSPFITAGVGFLLFDPYGDLKAANDSTYYYWADGSIRDLPETPANQLTAQPLQRDYTYETQLKDSSTAYARNSIVVPLGLGFRFASGRNFGGSVSATYTLCFTDYIDNVKTGGNDSYMLLSASLFYRFGREKTVDRSRYNDVDFKAIYKDDYDQDGVPDSKDDCQGTPKGVTVNSSGCPVDSDRDGVPDYRDKEPDSKRGYVVDENGVGLNYKLIAENAASDSISNLKDSLFRADPSLATLNRIEQLSKQQGSNPSNGGSVSKLPPDIQPADKDNNNFISAAEITKAIDEFFDGQGNWTVEKINKLIDFFFDQ